MNIKYAFAAAVLLMLLNSATAHAQGFRLNAYSGYTFDDRVNSYYNSNDYYEGTIKGGYRWGLGAEYMLGDDFGVEFSYLRQDTKAPISYYNVLERHNTFDLAANWIFAGATHYRKISETVEPYGGLMAGAGVFDVYNPDNKQGGTVTKFSWGARLGTNLFFSKTVGIKLQADLLSAVQSVGGGVYFGTGGAGTAVNTYSTMVQFHLGGGLVFRLRP